MSTPGTSEVHLIGLQHSVIRLNVGGAGPAAVKKVLNDFQEFVKSKYPGGGISFDHTGENVGGREHVLSDDRARQQVLPIYQNNQPQPNEHLSGGGLDTDMTSPPPDELYLQLPQEDAPVHGLEAAVATLTSKVGELTTENDNLKKRLDVAADEATELTSRLSKVTQERDDFGRQRQANQLKIRRLNDMIIKNGQNSDEPLDDEVLQDMFKIRNMTTDIIKRFYPGEATYKPGSLKDLTKRLNDQFYARFYQEQIHAYKNPERRRRLIISLLFQELQILFFGPNARRFGLPINMEPSFQELERMIEASTKVTAEENLEWRTRTVSYVGRLDLSSRETIERYANRLLAILEPMVLQGEDKYGNPDKRQVAGLSNALQDLCNASLKLALRFRSSKTKYEFKVYPDNTSLAACNEELIKKLDSEGPISKPMDPNKLRIFCTLFGALVKTRPSVSGQPGDAVVLEPGHVIVHEPQMRGPPH